MRTRRQRRVVASASLLADLLSVLALVASLRETARDLSGIAETAWPFLAALVAAWLLVRAWRAPVRVAWTGVLVWSITAALGMLLRAIFQEPMEATQLFVSSIALGVFVVGWRALVWTVRALSGAKERVVDDKYRR